jgi:hypothetical protein
MGECFEVDIRPLSSGYILVKVVERRHLSRSWLSFIGLLSFLISTELAYGVKPLN